MPAADEPLLQSALRNRLARGAGRNRLRSLGFLRAGGEGRVPIGRPPRESPRCRQLSAAAARARTKVFVLLDRQGALDAAAGRAGFLPRARERRRRPVHRPPRRVEPGHRRARRRADQRRVWLDPFLGRSAAGAAAVDQIAPPGRRELGDGTNQRRPALRPGRGGNCVVGRARGDGQLDRAGTAFPGEPRCPTPAPTTCSIALSTRRRRAARAFSVPPPSAATAD